MLHILQWTFYGKPFSVMLLACNCLFSFSTCLAATSTPGLSLVSLALPSPSYHFHQQHPHTLQVLHFYSVLVDIAATEAEVWQAVRGWVWLTAAGVCWVGRCLPKLGRNCRKRHHFTEADRNAIRPLKHTHVVGMSLRELSVSGETWKLEIS